MLNEELIYLDMPYSTQNELFEEMSKKFLELGYVNEEYLDALKKREEEFPTGIKTQGSLRTAGRPWGRALALS